ncbi:MAG: hypothetical protein SV186_02705 [Candidatus Nanohaloarchaea archaeon]|nr:hypothetical protein [Candidatus Nanohaloarchaea archaeon]
MSDDRLGDIDPGIRNWVIRKYEAGMSREEIKGKLSEDIDDLTLVDTIIDSGEARRRGGANGALFEDDLGTVYRRSVRSVLGVEERFFRNLSEQSAVQATEIMVVNVAVLLAIGALLPALIGAVLLSGGLTLGGLAVVGALGAVTMVSVALFAGTAHVFVFLLGGRGLRTTYNLCANMSALFLLSWIPFLNLFVWLYGLMVLVRGLEEAHDLSFFRSLAVAFLAVIAWLIVIAVLWLTVEPSTAVQTGGEFLMPV